MQPNVFQLGSTPSVCKEVQTVDTLKNDHLKIHNYVTFHVLIEAFVYHLNYMLFNSAPQRKTCRGKSGIVSNL